MSLAHVLAYVSMLLLTHLSSTAQIGHRFRPCSCADSQDVLPDAFLPGNWLENAQLPGSDLTARPLVSSLG